MHMPIRTQLMWLQLYMTFYSYARHIVHLAKLQAIYNFRHTCTLRLVNSFTGENINANRTGGVGTLHGDVLQ